MVRAIMIVRLVHHDHCLLLPAGSIVAGVAAEQEQAVAADLCMASRSFPIHLVLGTPSGAETGPSCSFNPRACGAACAVAVRVPLSPIMTGQIMTPLL